MALPSGSRVNRNLAVPGDFAPGTWNGDERSTAFGWVKLNQLAGFLDRQGQGPKAVTRYKRENRRHHEHGHEPPAGNGQALDPMQVRGQPSEKGQDHIGGDDDEIETKGALTRPGREHPGQCRPEDEHGWKPKDGECRLLHCGAVNSS